MGRKATKPRQPKPLGGDLGNYAFIYWSQKDNRYELKIDNVLKGHTTGAGDTDHTEGREILAKMAEEKGYTVLYG